MAQYFLQVQNRRYNKNIVFSSAVFDEMLSYSWPGNIRELENIIERLVVTCRDKIVKTAASVIHSEQSCMYIEKKVIVNETIPLKQAREELERQLIERAFEEGGNSYKAAELLGISQASAHRKIQKYLEL